MKTQIRIVAGSLKGRKLTCVVSPTLRPTPQRVREALFSILGNAVPERSFFDVFAGTGVVGLEALSRGARQTTFVERDFRLADEIDRNLKSFGVTDRGRVARADVYRWVERWDAPKEPCCVFLSPPFVDLGRRPDEMHQLLEALRQKIVPGSVLTVQAEESQFLKAFPGRETWDERRYGRNHLLFWVKPTPEEPLSEEKN
jgi:16S rRNA (guanine966-N2)-methyltransferase